MLRIAPTLAAEAADYSSIFVFLDEVCGVQEQTVQVHGQAAQVPGVNGAGSKTGAEPAPRIGLLRCSGGAGFGPKMEPAPSGC